MNSTSLFKNLMSLVPRRDPDTRHTPEQPDTPRFELPELPETSPRAPSRQDLRPQADHRDDHELDHERLDAGAREDEPEPRAELVTLKAPEGFTPADEAEVDGFDFDANGRARTAKGQADNQVAKESADETNPQRVVDPRAATQKAGAAGHTQVASAQLGEDSQLASTQGAQQGQPTQGPQAQGAAPQAQQAQAQQAQAQQAQAPSNQAATLVQATTPVVAQLALSSQDTEATLEGKGLEARTPSVEGPGKGLEAALEAGLDDLGLKMSDRVLGVSAGSSLSASVTQARADLSGEVADAVQRLLADAADESSLLRFRTEGGQTFLAQARLDPGQPIELRLLSDDPGVRAMLAERLSDLRSALDRVGFADAEVQVDRDPSGHGDPSQHAHPHERDELSLGESAPLVRRPAYGSPERAPTGAGRLHLIL